MTCKGIKYFYNSNEYWARFDQPWRDEAKCQVLHFINLPKWRLLDHKTLISKSLHSVIWYICDMWTFILSCSVFTFFVTPWMAAIRLLWQQGSPGREKTGEVCHFLLQKFQTRDDTDLPALRIGFFTTEPPSFILHVSLLLIFF